MITAGKAKEKRKGYERKVMGSTRDCVTSLEICRATITDRIPWAKTSNILNLIGIRVRGMLIFSNFFTYRTVKRATPIFLALFWLVMLTTPCMSENLFVRSGAAGSNNGSDWTNAWTGFSSIIWGSGAGKLSASDTLWIAGGTYTDSLLIQGTGSAGSPITFKRATANNSECTTAAGWQSGFDSQVVLDTGTYAIAPNATGIDWITIDGQVDNGIKVITPDIDNTGGIIWSYACNHWVVQYVEFSGPNPGPGEYNFIGGVRGIDMTPYTQDYSSDVTISHCNIHGYVTAIYFARINNTIVEHCKIYDILCSSSWHNNILYIQGSSNNGTFRYNEVYNYAAEGIYHAGPDEGIRDGWKIYGNIFHDGVGYARVLEVDLAKYGGGSVTNLAFYNNTVANMWMGIRAGSEQTLTGIAKNNIFYNVKATQWNNLTHDYNWFDRADSEPNCIANGTDPFENLAGKNFHIRLDSSARNHGTALGAEYNKDMDGNTRGAMGAWDIGVFEFVSLSPLNFRIVSQ